MSIKKDKVIEVATVLFAENGFENTSMANICIEANVSKGLIYHHFKSKEAILIEIFTQTTNQMIEMNENSKPSKDPKKQLLQLIDSVFSQMEKEKHLFKFNLNMMFNPTTNKILEEQIKLRASILFNSVKGIFNQLSIKKSEILSYIFIAEIDGIALSYLSSYNNYPLKKMKKELIKKYANYNV